MINKISPQVISYVWVCHWCGFKLSFSFYHNCESCHHYMCGGRTNNPIYSGGAMRVIVLPVVRLCREPSETGPIPLRTKIPSGMKFTS